MVLYIQKHCRRESGYWPRQRRLQLWKTKHLARGPQLSAGQDSGPLLTVPLPQPHAVCHPIYEKGKRACALSRVRLFVMPWTIAHQAPLSVGFPRQEILEWVAISWIFETQAAPALAGEFLTTAPPGKPINRASDCSSNPSWSQGYVCPEILCRSLWCWQHTIPCCAGEEEGRGEGRKGG